MFLGIHSAFWLGMGIVTAIVVIGCAVAWMMKPKDLGSEQN